MPVRLQDESTWIVKDSEIIADGDAKTTYTLRSITKQVYRDITKKHTKKISNRTTRAMEDRTDWEAASDDLLDFALVDWSGVTSGKEEAPCTRENKNFLDPRRQQAILEAAGLNQIEEAPARKAESFREPADVV
jgi:hypothetical protein